MAAMRCFQCGNETLSDGTRYVSLRAASRMIAWSMAFLVLRWCLHHPSEIVGSVTAGAGWLLESGLSFKASTLASTVYRAASWYVAIMALTLFLPKPHGSAVRSGLNRAIGRGLRFGWKGLVWGCRTTWLLIEGRTAKPKSGKAKGSG